MSTEPTQPEILNSEENQPVPQKQSPQRFVREFLVFMRSRLSLEEDNADPQETIDYIKKGVDFQGTNIWILVFAIMVASIGLNVNSAAVVIGAMLISPLMGPIMGIGMGVGINDFDLIKKAAKNLGLMVGISVVTSTLYFFISPISDAQSELLARTQPTIWDVLIALFGGLAGIVAGSRREKSNAIPGVAIATALMPPLCTAGYGLASGNMAYFAGAFYLFTINSVFISLSTFLIVRFLKYPQKSFIDAAKERKVKRLIGALVLVVTLPSTYIAFNLVRNTVFEREAGVFISENFVFDNCQVISRNVNTDNDIKRIEVALIGEHVSEDRINDLKAKMKKNTRLADAELIVRQGGIIEQGLDVTEVERINREMKAGIIEDLYKKNDDALKSKDEKIIALEDELFRLKKLQVPVEGLKHEIKAINPNVKEYTMMTNAIMNMETDKADTIMFAYVQFKKKPGKPEKAQLENWLKARTESDSLKMVVSY
jgi:uncharacterized hydrophobic protein (TIGR00271 family)